MIRYLLRRLLLFIPTLLLISVLVFWLGEQTPGDPLLDRMDSEQIYFPPGTSYAQRTQTLREVAARYELDRPPFYLSLGSRAYPDTLHRVLRRDHRNARRQMIAQYGNGAAVMRYFEKIERALHQNSAASKLLEQFNISHRPPRIEIYLEQLAGEDPILANTLQQSFAEIRENPTRARLYQPKISFHGTDNRYHHWLMGLLRGDFGNSYESGQTVAARIAPALHWTLVLSLVAIALSYLLGILLGVYAARHRGSRRDRAIGLGLFALYSLPTFWIGTLLLLFLTNPVYGMDWFAGPGLGSADGGFWERAWHLFLPVVCLTYPSLAFITRQVRAATAAQLDSKQVLAARARGLSERTVVWRYAFRNALFPLITILARVFPAAVAGSLIVEMVFNLPGMGRLTITSIQNQDYPTLFAIVLIAAVLTVIGILVADMLFALADPRVRYNRRDA